MLVLLPFRVLAAPPQAAATITISPSIATWSNAGYADAALPAGNTITISATIKTSKGGSGSITIGAPNNFTGANGAPFTPSYIQFTCTGTGYLGQTLTTAMTGLVPGGSATCATYGSQFNFTTTITVSFFLNDMPLNADTFTNNGFSFTATAA